MQEKLILLISQGEELQNAHFSNVSGTTSMNADDFYANNKASGNKDEWCSDVKLFLERNLKSHPLYRELYSALFHEKGQKDIDKIVGILKTISKDSDCFSGDIVNNVVTTGEKIMSISKNKIFIVHGHDNEAKETIARFIEKLGLESIILHEQASSGDTLIQKFERYSDVGFGIIIYSPDDIGKSNSENEYKKRARQNVIFEHGYLIGKLGREKVVAIVKGEMEQPSDISGVIYVPMDATGAWKMDIIKELKAVNFDVDANKAL